MEDLKTLEYEPKELGAFDFRRAMEEASRCLLCEDAPCSKGCPAGTDPGKFIRSIRFNNINGAAETIRNNNILGAVCALVCPQERLCQQACSRCGIDRPIEIGKLQQFAMEHERKANKTYLEKENTYCNKRVACVGAGPASLACAAELAKKGVQVTVLDEHDQPGGALRYEIPPYRLPDEIIDQDINQLKKLGVTFELNHRVTPEELDTLKKEYDYVFIGAGVWEPKKLNIPGADLNGTVYALDFLENARKNHGNVGPLGNVVIIGGGDVAMDCAATAKLLKATSVYVVFIESLDTAPAVQSEKEYAFKLGIPLISEFKPVEILGDGRVERVKFEHMHNGSTMELKADTVIFAIGQTLRSDAAQWKSDRDVYMGGDMKNGGDTVVRAVGEGKAAARKILELFK
jgi:Pyridine nucleotide-disulphide oxidoreductase.